MTIANEAAPTAQLKLVDETPAAEPEIEIRYAMTDEEVVAIHRFLLVVAADSAVDGINVVKSLQELIRVSVEGVALMAIHNGVLVATMGIMRATWWFNDSDYLTDRWHFCLPAFFHGPADRALADEAKKIAGEAGLRFLDNGKLREGKGGILRLTRRLYSPESATIATEG